MYMHLLWLFFFIMIPYNFLTPQLLPVDVGCQKESRWHPYAAQLAPICRPAGSHMPPSMSSHKKEELQPTLDGERTKDSIALICPRSMKPRQLNK